MKNGLLQAILFTATVACAPTYKNQPVLDYSDLEYASVDGAKWPQKFVELPEVTKRYGLPDKTKVCYVDVNPGGGPTLVLIHGLGSYLKFWRYQIDAFAAKGYRVVALDMLGYGKSDKPGTFPYTMESMADVVHELVGAIGAKDVILVGHSMGGQTALSYAIRYPKDLEALILTAPAGFEKFSRREQAWFRKVMTVGFIRATDEAGIRRSIAHNNFYNWRPELEWLIEERVRTARNSDFNNYAYANVRSVHGLADNGFVRGNLAKVVVPTLIIHGDKDRLIPNAFLHGGTTRSIMEHGHNGIKGSKLVTVKECGHALQLDCPDGYNQRVEDFLRSEVKVAKSGAGRVNEARAQSP